MVRLMLMQRHRDVAAGLNTAGYASGYRGSPIAGLEAQFARAKKLTDEAHIVFHPGLNEDLAATALWGTQQAELFGEGKYDGVFGIWYGKGPGVDRSGDAFRHANHAGTSRHGGVIALMGDDHTCESSTSAHQSEFAFVDAMMPILNPAGVQEILDYGVLGYALSRFAGVWVGMKCVKDNIESTAVVDGRPDRIDITIPDDFTAPEGGLNIRRNDHPLAREHRLHEYKRHAMLAFSRANRLDKMILSGGAAPRIGIITTGKSYLDTAEALDLLGIDELRAAELGVRLYKVAMTWPLEPDGIETFAKGLDTIIAVEEKRSLIETQLKEQLYGRCDAPAIVGKRDENDAWLFPAHGALEPVDIAIEIGERILRLGHDEGVVGALSSLKRIAGNAPKGGEVATRVPYFCAGCPHNTSTKVPDGSRAYAGIGCHYMVQWMDRETEGFTQMGAEGANWIGEAPFSKRRHVFQNLGDGTYTHSGSLAIRAAVAAGTNITYKILYNDAVAMTGGQALDGDISVADIARQVEAEGVKKVIVVTDEPEKYDRSSDAGEHLPSHVPILHRRDLMAAQQDLSRVPGVTVMIYDQTCAAEKRRRRKRGAYPDPAKRVFINPAVCEGCGDCGQKSNCVAVIPLETEFGRKRQIDQSACNKDYSCLDGFCPSFVTVHGGKLRKPQRKQVPGPAQDANAAQLPEPQRPSVDNGYAVVITGVGGTGIVTISAVLGQAAYQDGLGFGAIDMAGLAQKGGAVACHTRFAQSPDDIHSIRAGVGGADLVLGCDLVVTASDKVLETVARGKTALVLNTHEVVTGDFARDPDLSLPVLRIRRAIADQVGDGKLFELDANDFALALFGNSIASNMFMLGYAYQQGLIPVSAGAINDAIALNGAAVEMNQGAFASGRRFAHDPEAILAAVGCSPAISQTAATPDLEALIEKRAGDLVAYQDEKYAARYRTILAKVRQAEEAIAGTNGALTVAAAKSLHKLMAYKDEYEVARLFTDGRFDEAVREQFEGDYSVRFHLAPPVLARRDRANGEPRKIVFGSWIRHVFRLLVRMKKLRGTRWDIFGYTKERRQERRMIGEYEHLLNVIIGHLRADNIADAVELAETPLHVRGFGHVKLASHRGAKAAEKALLRKLQSPPPAEPGATPTTDDHPKAA